MSNPGKFIRFLLLITLLTLIDASVRMKNNTLHIKTLKSQRSSLKFCWHFSLKFHWCQKMKLSRVFVLHSITEDNFLLSNENLRSSPELWPEKIPGSDNFAKSAHKNARENANGLTQDDIRMIYRESILQNQCVSASLLPLQLIHRAREPTKVRSHRRDQALVRWRLPARTGRGQRDHPWQILEHLRDSSWKPKEVITQKQHPHS